VICPHASAAGAIRERGRKSPDLVDLCGFRFLGLARIENLLPGRPGTVGRNSDLGNRLFVDAVIWKFRVGELVEETPPDDCEAGVTR